MTTTIFLATLATPTLTSELYEFSIRDMAELYETKAFLSQEAAIAWGQATIDEHNEARRREDEEFGEDHEPFELVWDHTDAPNKPEELGPEARCLFWNQKGDVEDGNTDDMFCLRVWSQTI